MPCLHRWFVLQMGTAKFMIFENLRCIAGNCFDVLWARQLTSIGTSHGIQYFIFTMWSAKYLSEYWKFADYFALLDNNQWVKRVEGLDTHLSNGKLQYKIFCRWHHLGNWLDIARNTDLWFQYYTDLISFVQRCCYFHGFHL